MNKKLLHNQCKIHEHLAFSWTWKVENATMGLAFEGLQRQWRDRMLKELCACYQVTFHEVRMNYVTSEFLLQFIPFMPASPLSRGKMHECT